MLFSASSVPNTVHQAFQTLVQTQDVEAFVGTVLISLARDETKSHHNQNDDEDGDTLEDQIAIMGLCLALDIQNLEIANILNNKRRLESFISPQSPFDSGPIHDVLEYLGERPMSVKWLIEHGADLERRHSGTSWTPLHSAVFKGYDKSANILILSGANVNVRTTIDGNVTPLMDAASNGHLECCRILVENGAHVDDKDAWLKNTAYDYAMKNAHAEIAAIVMPTMIKRKDLFRR